MASPTRPPLTRRAPAPIGGCRTQAQYPIVSGRSVNMTLHINGLDFTTNRVKSQWRTSERGSVTEELDHNARHDLLTNSMVDAAARLAGSPSRLWRWPRRRRPADPASKRRAWPSRPQAGRSSSRSSSQRRPRSARGPDVPRDLVDDRGMLFDFGTPQPVTMWMRNTYIPLDMLFFAPTARSSGSSSDAQPLSDKVIASREPVRAVLELRGGITPSSASPQAIASSIPSRPTLAAPHRDRSREP